MKKQLFLANTAAEELSRQVSDERLKNAGVDLDKLESDPDLRPSVEAIKASRKKAAKLSAKKTDIKKLAGY
jgi:hypothetical protein